MLPRDRLIYPATTPTGSFQQLSVGMRAALDQASASIRAGSLGIGAAVTTDAGDVIATGRNRINETDLARCPRRHGNASANTTSTVAVPPATSATLAPVVGSHSG